MGKLTIIGGGETRDCRLYRKGGKGRGRLSSMGKVSDMDLL